MRHSIPVQRRCYPTITLTWIMRMPTNPVCNRCEEGTERSLVTEFRILRLPLKNRQWLSSATPLARRDSLVATISNGSQPLEMVAHPVPRRRLPKNRVFQQPVDVERPVHPVGSKIPERPSSRAEKAVPDETRPLHAWLSRRLITLIFAGRNKTSRRIAGNEGSPFRGPSPVPGLGVRHIS